MDRVSRALRDAYRILEDELEQTEVFRRIQDIDDMLARQRDDHFIRSLRALQRQLRVLLQEEPQAIMMATLAKLIEQRSPAHDREIHLALQRWENEGGAIL